MSKQNQAVDEVLIEMAVVTAKYLNPNEVQVLIRQWQNFEQVSVKMIQQCMLDIVQLYPKVKPYKSKIRRQFWEIVQAQIDLSSNTNAENNAENKVTEYTESVTPNTANEQQPTIQPEPSVSKFAKLRNPEAALNSKQLPYSDTISTFYTVIDSIKVQLDEPDKQVLFECLHQNMKKERTLKKHKLNLMPFIEERRPSVPDDIKVLSNVVQLVYACLCDIVGPSEADVILYQSAEAAKEQYANELVEPFF